MCSEPAVTQGKASCTEGSRLIWRPICPKFMSLPVLSGSPGWCNSFLLVPERFLGGLSEAMVRQPVTTVVNAEGRAWLAALSLLSAAGVLGSCFSKPGSAPSGLRCGAQHWVLLCCLLRGL